MEKFKQVHDDFLIQKKCNVYNPFCYLIKYLVSPPPPNTIHSEFDDEKIPDLARGVLPKLQEENHGQLNTIRDYLDVVKASPARRKIIFLDDVPDVPEQTNSSKSTLLDRVILNKNICNKFFVYRLKLVKLRNQINIRITTNSKRKNVRWRF